MRCEPSVTNLASNIGTHFYNSPEDLPNAQPNSGGLATFELTGTGNSRVLNLSSLSVTDALTFQAKIVTKDVFNGIAEETLLITFTG